MPARFIARWLAEAPIDTPPPGDLPVAGRAWVVLALFALLMGLLIALLLLTMGRRAYRRYAREARRDDAPSHARSSPWSEAGRRVAPLDSTPEDDDHAPDRDPEPRP